jgi:hypothetical protein
MSNIIYFFLTQNVMNLEQTNTKNRWGFGDILRGINNVHSVCQELGLELKILSRNHPLDQVLNLCDDGTCNNHLNDGDSEFVNFNSRKDMCKYLDQLRWHSKTPTIFTNGFGKWDYRYTDEFRKFIKPKITFRSSASVSVSESNQHLEHYDVLHVRLGDDALFNANYIVPEGLNNFISRIERPTVLMSDCDLFKNIYRNTENIRVSENIAVHTGVSTSTKDLIQTLQDFKLMSRAENIYTYSVYNWTSGFARSASVIYEVPIHRIKPVSFVEKIERGLKRIFLE